MRKRIALFANGWGDECLSGVGTGVYRYAKEHDMDVFTFVNYSIYTDVNSGMYKENFGEYNIYMLPDLKEFDGAVMVTNSFNIQEEIDYLTKQIREANIPAVSLLYNIPGMHFIDENNYYGMHELVTYLIQEHGDKNLLFIGGYKGHPECITRLQAFQDAAEENGIVLGEKNVQFANWSATPAQEIVKKWLEENGSLPDTIVCANDIMALGVCDWLKDNGYKIPDQVKVTGYDCLRQGQKQWPTLTTVSRKWEEMGYQAAEVLFDETIKEPVHKEMLSGLVKGGSTGSFKDRRKPEFWQELGREPFQVRKRDGLTVDQHFRRLYMAVRKNETPEDFNVSLSDYLLREGWMEGEYFMLCLHPDFFCLDETEDELKRPGYTEEIDMVCCLKKGISEGLRKIHTKEAVFLIANENEEPGLYIFAPLHSEDKNLGFAMMSRDFGIADNHLLYIWTRHMNQYLEQIRSNVKIAELTKRLTELSHIDFLTKTYNRVGCEEIMYPFLNECQQRGGRGVLMIADVDHMKQINDKYGHPAGDLALYTVATLLKEELPKGFMVARYGGDEFLLIGEWDGSFTIESVIKSVEDKLAKVVKEKDIQFDLTVSLGGVVLEAGEKFDLTENLQRADKNMYREKAVHHKSTDGK